MITNSQHRRKVLFVDDDRQYLAMMGELMLGLSQGSWEVLLAGNAGEALPLIRDQEVDLIVIDVRMPVLDGLQFMRLLNRRHPGLLKVVLTGFATEAHRAACLGSGAELFLEKPVGEVGHAQLFDALNGLLQWQPDEGFRGVLRQVGLQDVIQMECIGMNSSVLEVQTDDGYGRIFIHKGELVHAEMGALKGAAAFYHLLSQRGGEFQLRPLSESPPRTLEGSWEFLLMDAARLRDEGGPPPVSTVDAREDAGVANTEVGVEQTETGWSAQPEPGVDSARALQVHRTIEDFLVCSGDGKVLYEWGCRNSDLWINFLEFLSQKCRRLSQGLPLGTFHRMEAIADNTRLVALVQDNRGIVVRSRIEPPAA